MLQTVALAVLSMSTFLSIQALYANIIGGDGFYHIRLAEMMREDFIIDSLPQAKFTIFEETFSDKEFGFHVFLMPFTFGDLNAGAKLAACVLATLLVLALFVILRSYSIRWAFLAFLAFGALSARFWYTLLTPRAHLISMILVPLAIWALTENRKKTLFLLCFIQALSYTAWHLIPGIALIYVFLQFIRMRKGINPIVLYAFSGAVLGLLLHPHPIVNLKVWIIQNFAFYGHLFGMATMPLPAGDEMTGLTPIALWHSFPVEVLMMAFSLVISFRFRHEPKTFFWGVMATIFMAMTMSTIKFCHYWSPAVFVWFVLSLERLKTSPKTILCLGLVILSLGFAGRIATNVSKFQELRVTRPYYDASLIRALNNFVPENSFVFKCDWLYNTVLFFYRPDLRYPIILDPIFGYYGDRDNSLLWLNFCNNGSNNELGQILSKQQPNYFLLNKHHHQKPLGTLQNHFQTQIAWENPNFALFKVTNSNNLEGPKVP